MLTLTPYDYWKQTHSSHHSGAGNLDLLGLGDIETLTTRCNLASAFYTAGRLQDAVTVLRRALSDCERHLGPDHTMTSTVRANLDAATQV